MPPNPTTTQPADGSTWFPSSGFSSDAELDFTQTDALPSPPNRGSLYDGFGDDDDFEEGGAAAASAGSGVAAPGPAGGAAAGAAADDDVGDLGFEMSQEEVEALEHDHKKVYSKDMAFANSMSADAELKEQELQRLQLEALLRIKGGGDAMDAALSSIEMSAMSLLTGNSAVDTAQKSAKPTKKKGKGKGKGKLKASAPAKDTSATIQLVPETAEEIAANPALMSKAQLRLQQRRQLRANLVQAQQQAQSPAKKDRPNVGKIGEWGETEVAKWLGTIVEEASVHQWMLVVKKETINGRKLLQLTASDLATYTKGYLTISKEVKLVSEGIRRLNIEGAKAGRKTLRRAIGKKLGM